MRILKESSSKKDFGRIDELFREYQNLVEQLRNTAYALQFECEDLGFNSLESDVKLYMIPHIEEELYDGIRYFLDDYDEEKQ